MIAVAELRKGDEVFVVVRGGAGRHEVEQPGVITEMAGKGCFVRLQKWRQVKFLLPQQGSQAAKADRGAVAQQRAVQTRRRGQDQSTQKLHQKPDAPVRLGIPPASTIGQLIYQIRQERGVMQEPFARVIGVSAVTLSAYERGHQKPKDDELLLLAEVFDYDLTPLVEANERFVRSDAPETKAESESDLVRASAPISRTPPDVAQYVIETQALVNGAPGTIAVEKFQVFLEGLMDIAPMPDERDARKEYLDRARSFFWASGVRLQ